MMTRKLTYMKKLIYMRELMNLLFVEVELYMLYCGLVILIFGMLNGTRIVLRLGILLLMVSFCMQLDMIFGSTSSFFLFRSHWNIEVVGSICISVLIIIMLVVFCESSFLVSKGIKVNYEVFVLMYYGMVSLVLLMRCSDFLILYICMELYSLCMYGIVVMGRVSNFTVEAGIKYFVIGVVSSGLLLMGLMMCYGHTGGTTYSDFEIFLSVDGDIQLIVGGFLVSVGLFIKMGIAPFHIWVPDVYEGSITIVTMYLVTLPKVGLFFLLMRLSAGVFFEMRVVLVPFVVVIALSSLFFGTIGGLFQDKMKRLMAYSSIANSGYLLILMLLVSNLGLIYFYLYMVIYIVLVINVFSVLVGVMGVHSNRVLNVIFRLGFMLKSYYHLGISLVICLLGLAGIPPFVGFFAKLCVFLVILKSYNVVIFVIVILASVVSAVYYLRVIRMLAFNRFMWGNFEECSGLMGYIISVTTHIVFFSTFYNTFVIFICMGMTGSL